MLIEHFIPITVKETAPVPGDSLSCRVLSPDAGRAVSGDSVIPAWFLVQRVHRLHVLEEASPHVVERCFHAVKINVLAVAIVSPKSDHIALVGDNVD